MTSCVQPSCLSQRSFRAEIYRVLASILFTISGSLVPSQDYPKSRVGKNLKLNMEEFACIMGLYLFALCLADLGSASYSFRGTTTPSKLRMVKVNLITQDLPATCCFQASPKLTYQLHTGEHFARTKPHTSGAQEALQPLCDGRKSILFFHFSSQFLSFPQLEEIALLLQELIVSFILNYAPILDCYDHVCMKR